MSEKKRYPSEAALELSMEPWLRWYFTEMGVDAQAMEVCLEKALQKLKETAKEGQQS